MPWDDVEFTTRPLPQWEIPTHYETQVLLDSIDDLLHIQCSDGTWNYDPYMYGLANGMLLIRSIISGEDPAYLDPPTRWLDDEYNRPSSGARFASTQSLLRWAEEAKKKLTTKLKKDYPHEDYYLISEDMPLDELIPTVRVRYGPKEKNMKQRTTAIALHRKLRRQRKATSWELDEFDRDEFYGRLDLEAVLENAAFTLLQNQGITVDEIFSDIDSYEDSGNEYAPDLPMWFAEGRIEAFNRDKPVGSGTFSAITTVEQDSGGLEGTLRDFTMVEWNPARGIKGKITMRHKGTATMRRSRLRNSGRIFRQRYRKAMAPESFEVSFVCLCDFYGVNPEDFYVYENFPVEVYYADTTWSVGPTSYDNTAANLTDEEWAPRSDRDAEELYQYCVANREQQLRGAAYRRRRTAALNLPYGYSAGKPTGYRF